MVSNNNNFEFSLINFYIFQINIRIVTKYDKNMIVCFVYISFNFEYKIVNTKISIPILFAKLKYILFYKN